MSGEHVPIRVSELAEGDLVDGETLGDYLSDDDAFAVAPYEYFTVSGTERETEACVRVDFENADSYGLPPHLIVKVYRPERVTP